MEKTNDDIENVKLYLQVERIYKELRELGYKDDEPLKVEDVNKFDNYHYHGTDTLQKMSTKITFTSSTRCIDVGSGLGGTARYLVSNFKCHVTAVELQQKNNELGQELTRRCGLGDNVTHICGNFIDVPLDASSYDVLIGILVFLHIKDKESLIKRCAEVLKSGGKMYIEDMYDKGTVTEDERSNLMRDLHCTLITKDDYVKLLNSAGFQVEFCEVTDDWAHYTQKRLENWVANREHHVRVLGEKVYKNQLHFFTFTHNCYKNGNIGGCKMMATLSP